MPNRIISGLGWTTASSIVRNVVSLLQIAILARYLNKADFGIVAIANLFVGFTTMFLDMGISAGIIHRQNITNKEYSSLFWLNVTFGFLLSTILIFSAPLLTSKYNSKDLSNVVRLISLTILFSSLGTQQRTFCQKKSYFKRLSIIEIISYLTAFVVALLTAINGCGVYSLAYSTLTASVVLNIVHFVIAILKDNRLSLHFSFRETFPFLKIGIYQVGSSILDFLTRELDILIISATLGLEFLGVYEIAKRVPTALYTFILPIVNRVFAPVLAGVNYSKAILKETYIRLSKAMSWVSFPMYFLVAALSPTILTFVFGADYADGVAIMIVFSIKYAFGGANTICGALQVATGRTDIGLKWTVYSIISTAAVYFVTAQWGIRIFLIGLFVLLLLNVCIMWLIQFKPMTDISWKEYVSIYSSPLFISLLLSIGVFLIYSDSSLIYAIVSSIIFLIIYIFLLINSKDGVLLLGIIDTVHIPISLNRFIQNLRLKA